MAVSTEIRYIYQDTVAGVNIRIFYDESRTQVLCNFNNVQPNDEVICPIAGNTASSAAMGLAKFAKETPFTITYPGGSTCEAQYHTSCSRDIVGIVQAECTKLVVSGWRGANSGDCDDCKEPCDCDATEYTTTWNPDIYATRIGEHCYCDNGCTPAPTSRRRLGKKSKGKKSKGSKGKARQAILALAVVTVTVINRLECKCCAFDTVAAAMSTSTSMTRKAPTSCAHLSISITARKRPAELIPLDSPNWRPTLW
eukprot:TRINITY_DN4011_c0_g1_i1.p1 TRINITY_DN4011_c0_g1~~TRINITY_DN4011_c0_g1_i1.p1  ORF type:complete len:254 (-),score=22.60 TRINITY_DN4011_c0_g1_i1:355-1116(-)